MKKILFYFLILPFMFLQGCASVNRQPVEVNSRAEIQVQGGTYFLRTENIDDGDKNRLIEMLDKNGYRLSKDPVNSQYIITAIYGIEGPFQGNEAEFMTSPQLLQEDIANFRNPPEWMENPTPVSYYKKSLILTAVAHNNKLAWDVKSTIKSLDKRNEVDFETLLDSADKYIDKNSN